MTQSRCQPFSRTFIAASLPLRLTRAALRLLRQTVAAIPFLKRPEAARMIRDYLGEITRRSSHNPHRVDELDPLVHPLLAIRSIHRPQNVDDALHESPVALEVLR